MKKISKEEQDRKQLMEELVQIQQKIDTLYTNLSYIIEPELIDSCIYELNAFQCRYKFLLNLVKEKDEVKI